MKIAKKLNNPSQHSYKAMEAQGMSYFDLF